MMKKTLLILIFIFLSTQLTAQWDYVSETNTSFILYGMSFPPEQDDVGYACGMKYTYDADGIIIKTTDGGDNWTPIHPVTGDIDGLQGIWFIDENLGFAGGWNNYFIKTTDGGANWVNVSCGANVWYYVDVEFWDANNGVAAAKMTNSSQAVFITNDGGDTWTPATSGANVNIMGITYADQNTLFAVSLDGYVYKSVDAGHNWNALSHLSSQFLMGVDFANAAFGVIGGEEKMFATNDGGITWSTYTTGYENFYAVKAFSNGTAYVGGTDENIYTTTNYGNTWSLEHDGPGTSTLYRIRTTNNGNLFACGSQGKIIKKINSSSSINEIETSFCNLKIFPNPVKKDLNIQFNVDKGEEYTITIKSIQGKDIYTKKGTGGENTDNQVISLLNFVEGQYIISLFTKNKKSNKSFILLK